MTAPRFFLTRPLFDAPSAQGASWTAPAPPREPVEVPLSGEDLHHVADVLRLRVGEEFTAVEPTGVLWRLRAEEVSRVRLVAEVLERVETPGEPRVTLAQGVAKGPKMDRIVEQAVEVGVASILPVLTERSIVRLDADKRSERGRRWRRVAEAAAKQARRGFVPAVGDPASLAELLPEIASHDVVLVVWEDAPPDAGIARTLAQAGAGPEMSVALVIGPEGGLSADEVETLRSAGARVCGLGPSILRTETAGLVALVLTLSALGGLGADA